MFIYNTKQKDTIMLVLGGDEWILVFLKSLFQNSNTYYDAPTALQKLAHPEEVLYDQTHWYILH
jgi:hypothetical protein